jgi:hypothetical protein
MEVFGFISFLLSAFCLIFGAVRINIMFSKSGLTKTEFREEKKDRSSDFYKRYRGFVRIIVLGYIIMFGSFIIMVAPSFLDWIISYF